MEVTKEEKNNIRLYPIYKMISWDLLFYYSIIFLFLTQVKGISAADVLLAEAFYPAFKVILTVPLTILSAKIGKRKSLIFANLMNAFSIFSYIIAQDFIYVLIGQFFSAIAFDIKGVAETNLLSDDFPKNQKRGAVFSKIDGRGMSLYYYADAITSVASGFLYVVNGYIPLILCLISCLVSTFLVSKFKETDKTTIQQVSVKKYLRDLKSAMKYMSQSSRLTYLLVFGTLFTGSLSVFVSLRSGVLEQIGMPEQYFGVIFAVLGMVSGIAAKNQNRIHNRYRNKTLGILAIPAIVSCILIGFTVLLGLPYEITVALILILFLIQYIARGPFYTLIKRYLNNFTTSSLRGKITSAYNLVESLLRVFIALLASAFLRVTTASTTLLYIGCILTIIMVLLLDKMRNKVGLKPEDYKKSDIEFLDLK